MRGDFSRQTFDRTKHYSAVLMQQGRVQLDADWNEQQDINNHRSERVIVDAIGQSGAPNYAPGFEIKLDPTGTKLLIGEGRFYLEGFLCENEEEIAYEEQPDLIDPPDLIDLLTKAGTNTAIVYLDVWQRHLTALDDPHILEPALGGSDTTTRVKTVWQVKVLPVQTGNDGRDGQARLAATLRRFRLDLTAYREELISRGGGVSRPDGTSPADEVESWEERLNAIVPESETPIGGQNARLLYYELRQIRTDLNRISREMESIPATFVLRQLTSLEIELGKVVQEVNCHSTFAEWIQLTETSRGTLTPELDTTTQNATACEIPPLPGANGTENQLYRIEIHRGGEFSDSSGANSPTFKWARDNAIVTFGIERISGREVTVTSLGLDETMGLTHDQWVEIIDDRLELAGLPGQLVQIDTPPDPTTLVVTMKQDVTVLASNPNGVDLSRHPKLRRWEQSGDAFGLPTSLTPLLLESGVSASFSLGNYRTGDYWLLPTRSTGLIDWPPFEAPAMPRIAQTPMGIMHHYSRLAIVEVDQGGKITLQDCRRIFASLAAPAMRVVSINWANDANFSLTRLRDQGLLIWFDAEPFIYSLNPGSVIVTLEVPFTEGQTAGSSLPQNYSALSVILKGDIHVVGNNLHWAIDVEHLRDLFRQLGTHRASLSGIRVRVTLKGNIIHSDQYITALYLDGQALGQAKPPRHGSQTPVMGLALPSGSGARASDFESWFYLVEDSYGYGYEYGHGSHSIGGDLI